MGIRLRDRSASSWVWAGTSTANAPQQRLSPRFIAVFAALFAGLSASCALASQYVMLDYNLTLNSRARDTVFLELFDDKPLNVANFLQYVNNTSVTHGNYNGSIMHRLVPNFVLQGGGYWPNYIQEPAPQNVSLDPTAVIDLDGNLQTSNPTVNGEAGTSPVRSNLKGTVSMALSTGPNSGTSQWFVNLADNTLLDNSSSGGPFTVFAKVTGDGMNLLNAFNTLNIADLNPDVNNDGFPDGGPFGEYNQQSVLSGGVPYLHGASSDLLVVIEKATQIDYLGNGLTTDVPANGIAFTTRDVFIDSGTVFTGTGQLTVGNGRRLGVREGYALNRPLVNHGTVAPGLQLGSITVQGNYFQYFDGALDIQIAGTTADTQYDRLVTSATAFLDGKLNISFITGFTPAIGNSFTVLSASSIVGGFQVFNLPLLPLGDVWNIGKTSTSYVLTVAAADYNRNGIVDEADYILWRNSKNTSVTPYSGADGNGDGFVNDADYAIWRSNFGNVRGTVSGSGSGSLEAGSVPEPATAGLIAIIAGGLLGYRSRRD